MAAERWDVTGTANRLLDQYRESDKLIAMLQALLDTPFEDIRLAFESFYSRLAIAQSEGVQLDRIGDIVGAPRPKALTGDTTQPMADEDYRLFLRAIIYQNVNGSSVPELERYSELLLGTAASVLDGFTTVDLQFPMPLNEAQQAIIKRTFKVAAGIQSRYFTYSGDADANAFGFDGGPNSGYDDTSGAGYVRLFEEA